MTRSLEEADELSALDAKVLREIHTDGWQITGVLDREQNKGLDFAYSIGLFHTLGHPEIILFGLPIDACMRAVNLIALDIRRGRRFRLLTVYDRILTPPHTCCFREVDRKHYYGHVGYALWFYENDPFPMLQCFWSDEQGRFPWEPNCKSWVRDAQPLLFE